MSLLDFARDEFSQNGEDGVLEELFHRLPPRRRVCCEFGAWDGIHFSNTRRLVLAGWRGIFIESDPDRCAALRRTYADRPDVACLERRVGTGRDSLTAILKEAGLADAAAGLDLLSIDVDGPDFDIFRELDARPLVIVIEVNAGHTPDAAMLMDAAVVHRNVGQPLGAITAQAERMGYALAAYTGNAIYVRTEALKDAGLPALSDTEAYAAFLAKLPTAGREWLWLVNLGLVEPFHRYRNPHLGRAALGIPVGRAARLAAAHLRRATGQALRGRRS